MQAAAVELGELELGELDVAVEGHEAGEIDGSGGAEDLPGIELEVDAEAFGDLFGRRRRRSPCGRRRLCGGCAAPRATLSRTERDSSSCM